MFRMHKETYRKFRTKVEAWIPIGMSSNNKNIQLDEILLTWPCIVILCYWQYFIQIRCRCLWYEKVKICEICQLVRRILKESGFIKEFIRLPTMEKEAWHDISRKKWSTKYVLGYIIDGTYVEVYKRQNFALELTFQIEFEC